MEDTDSGDVSDAGEVGVSVPDPAEPGEVARDRPDERGRFGDAAGDVVVTVGPDGRIRRASDAVGGVLGYDPGWLSGQPVGVLVPMGGRDGADGPTGRVSELLDRTSDDGAPVTFEAADGTRVPMDASTSVTREDGGPTRYVVTASENSDPDRDPGESPDRDPGDSPDRDPRESPDRYRALFENDHLMVMEMDLSGLKRHAESLVDDPDDLVAYLEANPVEFERLHEEIRILDCNEKALEFYGAGSRRELVENFDQLMTDATVEAMKELIRNVVAGAENFRYECSVRSLAGELRHEILELDVQDGHADDYSRVFVTGLDVTDRMERVRELRRINETLDEFASVVSHDLAAPLGTIENTARLVEATGDTDHVGDIFEATGRIREMTDELLALAQRGEAAGETRPVELGGVAREAWRSVGGQSGTLTVETDRTVEADPERLRQLLENLLSNAVEHGSTSSRPPADEAVGHGSRTTRRGDATGDGGSSGSDGEPDRGSVSIRVGGFQEGFFVADDGPGIPRADREAVFERGVSTADDGSGLGLAIVEGIAAAHGWSVSVTESDEGGARFEVRIG